MNKLIRFFAIVLICSTCIQCSDLKATTRSDETYSIERAWFDTDFVYILYSKRNTTVSYSLSDIDGTVTKETNQRFVSKFDRNILADGNFIDLNAGEPAERLIYLDLDFYISAPGTPGKLFGQLRQVTSDNCVSPFWSADAAIRFHKYLFYCGLVFDRTGNVEHEIPPSVIDAIEKGFNFEPNLNSATMPTQTISTITNERILVVRSEPFNTIYELKLAVWSLGARGDLSWTTIALPVTRDGYEIANSVLVYSPTKFVLRSYSDYGWGVFLCDQYECKRVAIDSAWSYLIVDGDNNSITALALDNMTSPRVTVHVLGF